MRKSLAEVAEIAEKGNNTDSSVVSQGMQYRNDDAPNRGRGFGRGRGAGRGPTGHLVVPGTQ